jgi:hypothetical protein
MGALAVLGVAGVGAWIVTPLVSLARRGTIDQRTVASWREESDRVAVQRAQRRAAIVASVPAPRTAPFEQRRSPVAG